MKKIFVFSALILLAGAAGAQTKESSVKQNIEDLRKSETVIRKVKKEDKKELRKLEGKDVSYQSKQQFAGDFENTPVKQWVRTAYFDEASFMKNGKEMKAYYDQDSKLVGTTTIKSFDELPAKVQKIINNKYPGYSKEEVLLFDDNEPNETDMLLYGRQFDDADNYFIVLKKNDRSIILKADMQGNLSFFKELS